MSPKETAYIVERLAVRFMSMVADHERKMAEHRASFGARTEADRKIIEGLRTAADEQVLSASEVAYVLRCAGETPVQAAQRVVKERDGLLTQVQDQRAEIERLRNDERKAYQDGEALRAEVADLRGIVDMVHASLGIKHGDHIGNAIAALKAQSPTRSHPAKVGEWVRRTKLPGDQSPVGIVKRVTSIRFDGDTYGFADGEFWSVDNCEPCARQHPAQDGQWVRRTVASGTEPVGTMIQVQRSRTLHSEYVTRGAQVVPWAHCEPCDPPVDHDTPAGKEAVESVIRDFRSGDSEVSITGLFDDTKITVRREPDQDHGSRIVIRDANDMGEANIYLTESGARQMTTALIGLCDVRKVPQ